MSDTRKSASQYDETTPVLIVGGSLIGLSMSLFLSWHNIPSLLVERHPSTSLHPRLASLTPRTLEIYRSIGIESAIRNVEPPFSKDSIVLLAESLVGQVFDRQIEDMSGYFDTTSPVQGSLIAQDVLEPVLRTHAEQAGGQLRYATELIAFEQDEDGITATIREQTSGTTRRIHSSFLVGADGNQSGIRKLLGIQQHGAGTISHIVSMIFEADLMKLFREQHAVMCFINNDTVRYAALVPYAGSAARPDIFRLDIPYDPAIEKIEAYHEERCLSLIRAAVGIPDLSAKLRTVLSYEMAARVADHFQSQRVFLVGDAARVQPPTGALGGNTGIAEAQNLAWKLAAILHGEASPALLATYDQERRPQADYTVEQVTLLSQQRRGGHDAITVDPLTLNIGYRYPSGAIVPEHDDESQLVRTSKQWTGQPGTRAPHVVLVRNDEQISALDLFGRHFVLLVGKAGNSWQEAAHSTASKLHVPLKVYQIGHDLIDANDSFHAAYGITPAGAVLVRPDGFIGWRGQAIQEEPESVLSQALSSLLFKSTML